MPHVSSTAVNLDFDSETLGRHLAEASAMVVRLYDALDECRVTPAKSRTEIARLFDEELPNDPQPLESVLREVEDRIFANSTLYLTPRFLGYINTGGNHAGIIADLLASAVNQLPAKWHFSPAASEVERRVMRWLAEFIGYAPDAGGCVLSGGSAAHMVGLAVARNEKLQVDVSSKGLYDAPPATVYVSEEGHVSIDRAMALLGLGSSHLRKIPVRDDFTIDMRALERQVLADRKHGFTPICVIGNAGTTGTGAVDPLYQIAAFCGDQDLWFHVDGAYGAPAASTDIVGDLFKGLDLADSVVVNPHKWLYLPAEAACILMRDRHALRSTFQMDANYLQENNAAHDEGAIDYKDYNPQLSRSFKALKLWMTFKVYGTTRLRRAIASNIEVMRYLAGEIDASDDFIRLAPVPLSAVCFQYRTADSSVHGDADYLSRLNDRLIDALESDGRVFVSRMTIRNQTVMRACSVNHRLRKEHVDFLLAVIRDVARTLPV